MKFLSWFFLLLGLGSQTVWSCAVCFGGADQNWSRGFYWGILLLLLLPLFLFLAIGGRIYLAVRKKSHSSLPGGQ